VDNLESALVDEPEKMLEKLNTSIEVVEFIGTLSGLFGKFKTDEIELVVKNPQMEKIIDKLIESVKKGEVLDPELSEP
jgi:hypothetical protein